MKSTVRMRFLAALGCAVALSACGGNGDSETPRSLPNVTGLTLAQAEQRLQNVNVSWTLTEREGTDAPSFDTARASSGKANKALAARRVLAQDPKPGYKAVSGDVILLKLRR
jgi:hypothetical protein